jgi:antitoxin HigA-1
MTRVPSSRTPTHPGEMLLEEFLVPMRLTQRALAAGIHVPYRRVNDMIHGRRPITPATALRLGQYFGVSPDFWLNLQMRWDLYFAQKDETEILEIIRPVISRAH